MYVHIPFCARRCDYCAFATHDDRDHLIGRYLRAVAAEIDRAVEGGMRPATSVFVGGGTPSRVPATGLARLLDRIPREPGAEVTVECNPDDAGPELLGTWREAGVTRVSLGVQSTVPRVLAALGRTHDPGHVERAVAAVASAGFTTWNIDLIYGARGETASDWMRTLTTARDLGAPHVSAYALTVEAGTPLARAPERHPDPDDQADKYLAAESVLTGAGLVSYEISNWAVPGHECRHNLLTWAGGDYRGFGCAAHSHIGGRRSWNIRHIDRYLTAVESGEPAEAGAEVLDDAQRHLERLVLAVRTRWGVPAGALDLDDPVLEGLCERVVDRVRLTVRGRLLANEVELRLRVPPPAPGDPGGSDGSVPDP